MRTKSTINVLLTIEDFYLFDSSDINGVILDLLRQKYEHVCYGGYFIYDVVRILHRSSIEANQFDTKLSFNVNVCMEIDCEHLMPFEALMHLPIIKKTPDAVILKNDNLVALLKVSTATQGTLAHFGVGDLLPVKVGTVITDIGDNLVKVNAMLFAPTPVEACYRLLASQEKAELSNQIKLLADTYQENLSAMKELQKKSPALLSKYLELLFPYAKGVPPASKGKSSVLEILAPNNNAKAGVTWEDISSIAELAVATLMAGQQVVMSGKGESDISLEGKVFYMGDSCDPYKRIAGKVGAMSSKAPTPVPCIDTTVQDGVIILLQRENRFLSEVISAMAVDLIEKVELTKTYVSQKK